VELNEEKLKEILLEKEHLFLVCAKELTKQ